jgi:Membrane transporters of cations and cationic drugs
MNYILLFGAILCEVIGTMLLPLTNNFTKIKPVIGLVIAYSASFYLLTFPMREIPVAIVYATWAGLGLFLITVASYLFFGQSLQWQAILGLILIVLGVVLVNSYSKVP